ncbi:TonB-dependent receptor [Brevundimonas sp.]|jgi:iron complex outermembrane receptor protein|uniref:TonB-dependent receptor n=1 Tax=Brevundimonas sp. TaxID=1871086 RepID=UPI0037848BE6
MNRRLIRRSLQMTTAVALILPAMAGMVQAQSADPGEPAVVEEIVVTAQRRSESLQRVPVSVTAVTAEELSSRNINDLGQLAVAAPSLQVGSEGSFSVRGVGTLAFAQTIDSSVAIAIDDVNLGRPNLGGSLFNDVAQVEVLNGPQGLLFGKNASAGLLNITTTRPRIGIFESLSDVEAGVRDTPGSDTTASSIIARQTLNFPIGDRSALRLNAILSKQEPGTTFVGNDNVRNDLDLEQWGLRAKFLSELNDSTTLYVIGEFNRSEGVAGFFDRTYRSLGAGSVNGRPLAGDGVVAAEDNFTFGGDGGYWRDLDTGGLQASLSHVTATGLEISNIAAWKFYDIDQQLDTDFTNSDGANVNAQNSDYDQFSNELRVALPAGDRLSGQAGLYYFHSQIQSTNQIAGSNFVPSFVLPTFPFCVGATPVAAPPPACSFRNDYFLGSDHAYEQTTDSYAAFGQFTYELTEALRVIGGARVTRDEIDIDLVQNLGRYFVTLGAPGTFDESYANTNWSYKAGLQYQITPDVMGYATYGRGYKGPGFNDNGASPLAPLLVRPEVSSSIEAGVRSSFFERRLILNASVFRTEFDDYQTQSFDPILSSFIIQNAASVISQGAEITAIAALFDGFTLNASVSLLDSEFDDFNGAQCYPGQATPSCAVTGSFNVSGLSTPNSPKFTSTLSVNWEPVISGGIQPVLRANWYHRDSMNFLINQAPGAELPSTDIFGASIGARFDNGVEIALFCKNCTNEHNPVFMGLEPGDAIANIATYQQQFGLDSVRLIGLKLTYSH